MPHFTKGTWAYSPDFSAVVVVSKQRVVPIADFGKISLMENDANGKLIGASKEMYDALKKIVDKHPEAMVAVNRAIYKAENGGR